MTQVVELGSTYLSVAQVLALTSLELGYVLQRQPFYLATLAEGTENLTLGIGGVAKIAQHHNQPLSSGGLEDTRGHHLCLCTGSGDQAGSHTAVVAVTTSECELTPPHS